MPEPLQTCSRPYRAYDRSGNCKGWVVYDLWRAGCMTHLLPPERRLKSIAVVAALSGGAAAGNLLRINFCRRLYGLRFGKGMSARSDHCKRHGARFTGHGLEHNPPLSGQCGAELPFSAGCRGAMCFHVRAVDHDVVRRSAFAGHINCQVSGAPDGARGQGVSRSAAWRVYDTLLICFSQIWGLVAGHLTPGFQVPIGILTAGSGNRRAGLTSLDLSGSAGSFALRRST
jgi:hypothetical protein